MRSFKTSRIAIGRLATLQEYGETGNCYVSENLAKIKITLDNRYTCSISSHISIFVATTDFVE